MHDSHFFLNLSRMVPGGTIHTCTTEYSRSAYSILTKSFSESFPAVHSMIKFDTHKVAVVDAIDFRSNKQ